MAIYLNALDGSDPPILDVLALKESQSMGIIDPGKGLQPSFSDDSRIKALARACLGKRDFDKLKAQAAPVVQDKDPETVDMFETVGGLL
jgi:hypothetical protein